MPLFPRSGCSKVGIQIAEFGWHSEIDNSSKECDNNLRMGFLKLPGLVRVQVQHVRLHVQLEQHQVQLVRLKESCEFYHAQETLVRM